MAFYMSLENKLDIDNDTDIISSHTGGGGVTVPRRRVNFDNPGFSHLFFSFSELNIKGTSIAYRYISLEQERHLHSLYEPPPPLFQKISECISPSRFASMGASVMNMYSLIHENLQWVFFQLKLCQTARKRRPHYFFTHFDVIFWICAEANIVPLNL